MINKTIEKEMSTLVDTLNKYADAYYLRDESLISDKEYDALYDRLVVMERESGIILSDSPTQRPGGAVIDGLQKVFHSKPMLSAAKTKDISVLKDFIRAGEVPENPTPGKVIVSWEEDGLTIVLRYRNGHLVQAITRGDGNVGEDVTHSVRRYQNVPLQIPCEEEVEVRGEGMVALADFEEYTRQYGEVFTHPRNMAAGSTRILDGNETAKRKLSFVAFELVLPVTDTKTEEYRFLEKQGFHVVEHISNVTEVTLEETIKHFDPQNYEFPVDGLIIEHESKTYGRSLGATGHHESCRMALKWQDETVETEFERVDMAATRTGTVSLTAVFKPVKIDGSTVSRATLHNLTFFKKLKLGLNDKITVYKSNMIIPAIDQNLTCSNNYVLPMVCPSCGAALEIHTSEQSGTETLHCPNDECPARRIAQFEHFVSRDTMDIRGLSGAKLEVLLQHGFVKHFADLYRLNQYKDQIEVLDGWGKRSFAKLSEAVEESRNARLEKLIPALGIPTVGRHAGKDISRQMQGDPVAFMEAVKNRFDFTVISDFGDIMQENLYKFFLNPENVAEWDALMQELVFVKEEDTPVCTNSPFAGKSIVATGTLNYFSRNGINRYIEKLGAVAKGSVSKKTDFVVYGESAGSKLTKAHDLGVKTMTEAEFLAAAGVTAGDEESVADRS